MGKPGMDPILAFVILVHGAGLSGLEIVDRGEVRLMAKLHVHGDLLLA